MSDILISIAPPSAQQPQQTPPQVPSFDKFLAYAKMTIEKFDDATNRLVHSKNGYIKTRLQQIHNQGTWHTDPSQLREIHELLAQYSGPDRNSLVHTSLPVVEWVTGHGRRQAEDAALAIRSVYGDAIDTRWVGGSPMMPTPATPIPAMAAPPATLPAFDHNWFMPQSLPALPSPNQTYDAVMKAGQQAAEAAANAFAQQRINQVYGTAQAPPLVAPVLLPQTVPQAL
jgi:hypothetical protein